MDVGGANSEIPQATALSASAMSGSSGDVCASIARRRPVPEFATGL